jgi:hypothetical protein
MCHPERSEGSAFSSSHLYLPLLSSALSAVSCQLLASSPFNLKLSTFNRLPFLDVLDAASNLTPLFATLTKNTRGGVSPPPYGEKNESHIRHRQ